MRHGTRFGASLMTLEIQFRLHRNLEIPPHCTLRDNFVTVEMYQRRGVCEVHVTTKSERQSFEIALQIHILFDYKRNCQKGFTRLQITLQQ